MSTTALRTHRRREKGEVLTMPRVRLERPREAREVQEDHVDGLVQADRHRVRARVEPVVRRRRLVVRAQRRRVLVRLHEVRHLGLVLRVLRVAPQ